MDPGRCCRCGFEGLSKDPGQGRKRSDHLSDPCRRDDPPSVSGQSCGPGLRPHHRRVVRLSCLGSKLAEPDAMVCGSCDPSSSVTRPVASAVISGVVQVMRDRPPLQPYRHEWFVRGRASYDQACMELPGVCASLLMVADSGRRKLTLEYRRAARRCSCRVPGPVLERCVLICRECLK